MYKETINELENAARIIMAGPNLVTNEERNKAQGVILNFGKTKSPFAICRQILEESKVDYLLFEAAEVIKQALIREWNFLPSSDKESLKNYLLKMVVMKEMPSFVRDRILQVICIMVKRASADDGGRQRTNILNEVENLILNEEHSKKILGCQLIIIMMQEYATTVKSTDVGLVWEVHFSAKRQFESTDLKRIFKFVLLLLSKIVENDAPYEPNIAQLMEYLLQIVEHALSWGHISPMLPKRLIGMYESSCEADEAPALSLSAGWGPIILSPDFLPLMFQIYWKVRYSEKLAHYALSCLVRLASWSSGFVQRRESNFTEEDRSRYLVSYLENFSKLISSITIKNKESLGISNIVKKLSLHFTPTITKIDQQSQMTFLDEITLLTCNFCEGAAMEESNSDENKYYNDSLGNMLEAWTFLLLEYGKEQSEKIFRDNSIRIFNKYLQCRLGPPDGIRSANNSEVEEIEDNEDNDRSIFKDQLQTIGIFGRIIPDHALPIIFKLIESSIEKLKVQLQSMQNHALTLTEATQLENIFEDIHWTLLIAGHVLCMDSDGETPMIPTKIMEYSLDQIDNGQSTLDASLRTLASVRELAFMPECIEQCDHNIRIFSDVLRLCVLEDSAASVKLGHFMSPEVSCSIMWLLKRWCLSYLIPVENYYAKISPIFFGAVGKDTEGASFTINFILTKIQSNICHFHSEPVLLRDTVNLFADIVCVKQKSQYIIKTEGLWNLINMQKELKPGHLPPEIRRGLYKGFVLSGTSLQEEEMSKFYQQVLQPIQDRFCALTKTNNASSVFHQEAMQNEIIDLLECLIGVAKGAQMSNVEILFGFVSPILFYLSPLLGICNNYQVIVQLILELFCQVVKNMLCFLNHADSQKLYESSCLVVQTYAKCNANRLSSEVFAEESSFQDLALVLELLTCILSKDCLDFYPGTPEENVTVTASEVSLFGLNFIMPLMTMDLLKYPSLCAQYYKLLVLINDIYPEKICKLPSHLLDQLLYSIEIGLSQFGSDITQSSLDFIMGMGSYLFKQKMTNCAMYEALRPFLKLLLDLTLSQKINSDLMSIASTSIHALICCYGEEYKMLVRTLVQSQQDPLTADRLSTAFDTLLIGVELNCERQSKLKFRSNFERFIPTVHGFLIMK